MRSRAIVLLALFAAEGSAQTEDFGSAYSFAERKPQTRVEKTIDSLLPSIVKVHGASGLATITSYATGIIVSERGHIVTLDQVLVQKGRTRVVLYDGSVHRARVLPDDEKLGVRLLKINPADVEGKLRPVWPKAGDGPLFRTGQFVVSLGNSFRLAEFSEKVSATFGVINGRATTALRFRLSDQAYDGELILTDACNNQGNYGGGLFDLQGNWIGLNMRLLESKETNTMLSAAIPSRDLLPYLNEYINDQDREEVVVQNKPAYTGIILFEQAGRQSPPAYVDRVKRGSPAAKAGLRPDDLLVRINEFSVRSCVEYRKILKKYSPGDVVELTFKRGNKIKLAKLELTEVPQ